MGVARFEEETQRGRFGYQRLPSAQFRSASQSRTCVTTNSAE
jgi:hypothetical protein